MSQERRQFQRLTFEAQAQLVFAGQAQPVQILDLSLKGALVAVSTPLQLPKQAPCQLIMQLGEGCHIAMHAEVAHCQAGQLGLRCISIDLDSMTHLRRLVELHLGDTRLLERELSLLCASCEAAGPAGH